MHLRHPAPDEQDRVHAAVQAIVDETYAFVWPEGAPPISPTDWCTGWLAEVDGQLAGIMLTAADWLDDLWVARGFRRRGIGSRLLAAAEAEIAARGHAHGKLRVVAGNDRAMAFYLGHGWAVADRRPHERLPVVMVTLAKALR